MITVDEFKALQKSKAKSHKFGAVRCRRGEVKFPSKLERSYYDHLVLLQKAKEIDFFLRQVPLYLPGNIRYVVDFVVFKTHAIDGLQIEFIDVKGKPTATYKMKKKMVEEMYPIKIIEVKKGDF